MSNNHTKPSDNSKSIVNAKFWQAELAQHQGKLIDADNDSSYSYSELNEAIECFIQNASLTSKGSRQLVALIADNSLAFVIAYLALLRSQHVILLLEDPLSKSDIMSLATHLNSEPSTELTTEYCDEKSSGTEPELAQSAVSKLSLSNQKLLATYPVNGLVCGSHYIALNKAPIELHPSLALLLSTSGSTGSSKLVKLSYENLSANTQSICSYLPISAADTAVTTLPLHYSFGLSVLHSHLAVGASIVLTNATPLEKSLWTIYKTYQPSSFYGVPFSFELLHKLQLKRLPLGSVKYFAQAGGKMNPDVCLALHDWCSDSQHNQQHCQQYSEAKQLFLMYGQTEATARIAYLSPEKLPAKVHAIGQAIPDGELSLRDDNDKEITSCEVSGELYYKGPNVFIGYAHNLACLASTENIEWLKTGDLAMFDDEGDFYITGRTKRIIKVLGKRISLDEVEQYLTAQLAYNTPINIVVSGGDDLLRLYFDKPDVEQKLTKLAAEFAHINPRYISLHYQAKLPRLSNGKIAYEQLND